MSSLYRLMTTIRCFSGNEATSRRNRSERNGSDSEMDPGTSEAHQVGAPLRLSGTHDVETAMCRGPSQPRLQMLRRFDPPQVFEALKEHILNDIFRDGPAEEEIESDEIQHRFVPEHQGF
jgi:hypothetical protein